MSSARRHGWIVALVFGALAWPVSAQDDRNVRVTGVAGTPEARHALVIGNVEYESGKLKNPVNDARAVAAELQELGFAVTLLENAALRPLEDAIRQFASRLRAAGGVGIFYFAGHGVQVDGFNYLLPVGADIRSETDIRYKAVELGFLLDNLGDANNQLNVVLLDACRDNPFRGFSRTLSRGLAQATAPTGTLIGYATGPGKVAADGAGEHSPFTEHLLAALAIPGLTIEGVMKRTMAAVKGATNGKQVPWMATSLVGEFVPRPKPPAAVVQLTIPKPPQGGDFSLDDLRRWNTWLDAMKKAFAEAVSFEAEAGPVALKREAWQRFLGAFSDDHPAREDDDLRQQARARLERLQAAGETRTPPPPSPPSPPPPSPPPVPRKAGDVVDNPKLRGLDLVFRFIPAGTFQMGSPNTEKERDDDEMLHQVTLTRDFAISETEVTQAQWQVLMGNKPSRFQGCDACPVEQVNWYEALAFANALSQRSGLEECYVLSGGNDKKPGEGLEFQTAALKSLDCRGYRLPTEAEWEYAARAGTRTPFWTGENLTTAQANYDGYPYAGEANGASREKTIPVRSFKANPWGLYEVHGNVKEWTQDFGLSADTYKEGIRDPLSVRGSLQVTRGGGWYNFARYCRAALRNADSPSTRSGDLGFRLVRTLP